MLLAVSLFILSGAELLHCTKIKKGIGHPTSYTPEIQKLTVGLLNQCN